MKEKKQKSTISNSGRENGRTLGHRAHGADNALQTAKLILFRATSLLVSGSFTFFRYDGCKILLSNTSSNNISKDISYRRVVDFL